jgi:hypothetical protein
MEIYPDKILKLLDTDGFINRVEKLQEFGRPIKEAYMRVEIEYMLYYKRMKYTSYNAFRQARIRYLNKHSD